MTFEERMVELPLQSPYSEPKQNFVDSQTGAHIQNVKIIEKIIEISKITK